MSFASSVSALAAPRFVSGAWTVRYTGLRLPVTGSLALTVSRQAPARNRLCPFTSGDSTDVGWKECWQGSGVHTGNLL